MNKKLKITTIISTAFGVVVTLTLVLLGLAKVNIGYVGLDYNLITANYTSNTVYEPGLYYIGVSSQLIRIKSIPTIVALNINTYTSDFYTLNSKIITTYQLSAKDFNTLSRFYINFGEDSQKIINSVFKNEVVQILSKYSSSDYQTSSFMTTLQTQISSRLSSVLLSNLEVSMATTVLIQSLVINGVSSNDQQINAQIEYLVNKLSRVESQNVQLSDFIASTESITLAQLNITEAIVKNRISELRSLISLYSSSTSSPNISSILFGNQIIRGNLSFASSHLSLRPELYQISSTPIF